MAPDGLTYIDSWVADDMSRCWQVMECDDPALLRTWMAAWEDLVDFEVTSIVSSSDAVDRMG